MINRFLIVYDFYVLQNGGEHFGIPSILTSFLDQKGVKYNVIKVPLTANPIKIFIKLVQLFGEVTKENYSQVYCYNLINAINAWIVRLISFKNYKIIFISVDFTKNRFNNFLLNNLYIFLDYLASILSDEVWSCSKRVHNYRESFVEPKRNFYVPNLPNYEIKNLPKFEKFTILMISFLNFNYMFEEVYKTFEYLKEKDIDLYIVGEGDLKSEIENKIKENNIGHHVKLTGLLQHDEIKKLLEKCHIGLALYGGKMDFNFWGDSLKIREYTYYNLPVITTKNVFNEKEVREQNLGVCLEDYGGLLNSIKFLYENKKSYLSIVESTKKYNSTFGINKIYEKIIKI